MKTFPITFVYSKIPTTQKFPLISHTEVKNKTKHESIKQRKLSNI